MISLKQLLQEQQEENFVFSDEFMDKVKTAAAAETDPAVQAVTSAFYDVLFPDSVSMGMIAAGLFTLAFRKKIGKVAGSLWKSGYNPVKLVGKQLAIHAPMKAFLRLDKAGAEMWTQNAILAPLKRIQSANSSTSDMHQQAYKLESQILAHMEPADFEKLAMATRKQFQSKTYEALSTLRQPGGSGKISGDLQRQFEKLFVELNRINSSIFNEAYIQVTLKSLDIKPEQITDILTNIFPASANRAARAAAYANRAPIRPTMLTKANLQATQSSGTISKSLTFAQDAYRTALPMSYREIFDDIVKNLPAEINKRANYVDDLMGLTPLNSAPHSGFLFDEWRKLNIPDKKSWDKAEQYRRYTADILFYHANKLSSPTIK